MKINRLKIEKQHDKVEYNTWRERSYLTYNHRAEYTINGFQGNKVIELVITDYGNDLELDENSEIEIIIRNKTETKTIL